MVFRRLGTSFAALNILALLLPLLPSCGPGAPSSAEDFQTVATAQDKETDFSNVRTYALSDSVQAIQDPNDPSSNSQLSAAVNDQVIAKVKSNLDALGWTRLTDTAGPKPDVIVQVSSLATTHTDVYYSAWYPYWGGYYGSWYGPTAYTAGWGPTAVPVVVNSTVGSLIMDMTNPNQPNTADKKIPSLWVGIINNLLSAGLPTAEVQTAAINGIDQAFAQSPYLKGAR